MSFTRFQALFIFTVFLLLGFSFAPISVEAGEEKKDEAVKKLLEVFVGELVEINPGKGEFPKSFVMGREKGPAEETPAREVTLKSTFSIAKYEVPQNLYEAVMGENPSRWKGPRNSVEMVSIKEMNEFCTKLTQLLIKQKMISAEEEIRLPTEAEWEYCCRAGTTTLYSFGEQAQKKSDQGNQASLLDPYAWHTGNAAGNDPPVGALKPNPWGLYDMHGYLSEVVQDSWTPSYKGASRVGNVPVPAKRQSFGVIRGGSWKNSYEKLTSTSRESFGINKRDDAVGFRCVKCLKRVKK